MVPTGEEELDPSKKTVEPLIEVLKAAVGAWSGIIAIPNGYDPTVMAAPVAPVDMVIGVTELLPVLHT